MPEEPTNENFPNALPTAKENAERLLQRVGSFSIDADLLRDDPEAVMLLMAHVVVLRCEHRYATRRFEYEALSHHFHTVSHNFGIPAYDALLVRNADGTTAFGGFKLKE